MYKNISIWSLANKMVNDEMNDGYPWLYSTENSVLLKWTDILGSQYCISGRLPVVYTQGGQAIDIKHVHESVEYIQ